MTAEPDFIAFRDVLYDSLAGAGLAAQDAAPMDVLRGISVAAFRVSPESGGALMRLNDIAAASTPEAAVAVARSRYATAAEFREAVYFARCLSRDPVQTLRLLAGRAYLEDARLTEEEPQQLELATDRLAVLELATFQRGWVDPMRIEGSLNLIRMWRITYVELYEKAHTAQQTATAGIFDLMEATHVPASALRRLNTLRRLGPPVGVAALDQHAALERLFPCPISGAALLAVLEAAPICAECGFRLGDIAPAAEARRVASAVERGLGSQQTRLARRVVLRLLSRPAPEPETKLQRFIEVVQASDLTGLAAVLDDEVVAFIDDVLSDNGQDGVLSRVAGAYPTVTAENLEAAVAEFRRLLAEEAAREGIVRLRGSGEGHISG